MSAFPPHFYVNSVFIPVSLQVSWIGANQKKHEFIFKNIKRNCVSQTKTGLLNTCKHVSPS